MIVIVMPLLLVLIQSFSGLDLLDDLARAAHFLALAELLFDLVLLSSVDRLSELLAALPRLTFIELVFLDLMHDPCV